MLMEKMLFKCGKCGVETISGYIWVDGIIHCFECSNKLHNHFIKIQNETVIQNGLVFKVIEETKLGEKEK